MLLYLLLKRDTIKKNICFLFRKKANVFLYIRVYEDLKRDCHGIVD